MQTGRGVAVKLRAVFREGRVFCFRRIFPQFILRIYLFSRDLSLYSNAYGNGNYRARHAAAGFLSKTRYNFTRLGRLLFLHGPGTAGWYIFSVHFTYFEWAVFGNTTQGPSDRRIFFHLLSKEWQTRSWLNSNSTLTPGRELILYSSTQTTNRQRYTMGYH